MANSKVMTLFAGVNGVGKSTLFYILDCDFGKRLNSDELVTQSGKDWRDMGSQLEAVKKISELQEECLNNNISFNRETTVPGRGAIKLIKKAKEKKFKVQLYYVGVESVDICKKRVAERVKKGGHGVSEDLIEARYNSINKSLIEIFDYCDNIQLFDNSFSEIQLVAYKENNKFVKVVDNCKWLNELLNEYSLAKESEMFDFKFDD